MHYRTVHLAGRPNWVIGYSTLRFPRFVLSERCLPSVPLIRFSRCSYSLCKIHIRPPRKIILRCPRSRGCQVSCLCRTLGREAAPGRRFAWSCGGSCAVEVGDVFFFLIRCSGSRGQALKRSCALVSGMRSPSPLPRSLVDIHLIAPSRFARNLLVDARARSRGGKSITGFACRSRRSPRSSGHGLRMFAPLPNSLAEARDPMRSLRGRFA